GTTPKANLGPTARPARFTVKPLEPLKPANGKQGPSEASVKAALASVPTVDNGVRPSLGKPPALPLSGDADPGRAQKAVATGLDSASKAHALASQQVVNSKGAELVTPATFDEKLDAGALQSVELEAPPVIDDAVKFTQLDIGPTVQGKFDEMYGAQMKESVAPAVAQVKGATDKRDLDAKSELAAAQAKAESLNVDAQSKQDALVTEQRKKIQ